MKPKKLFLLFICCLITFTSIGQTYQNKKLRKAVQNNDAERAKKIYTNYEYSLPEQLNSCSDLNTIVFLIKQDFLIDHDGYLFGRAIELSCKCDSINILKELIEYDSSLLDKSHRITYTHSENSHRRTSFYPNSIMLAAQYGNLKAFKLLIENGASINTLDGHNNNLLYYAAQGGNLEMIEYLVTEGISINNEKARFKNSFPIYEIFDYCGNSDYLLDYFLKNMTVKNIDIDLVFDLACIFGDTSSINYLIEKNYANDLNQYWKNKFSSIGHFSFLYRVHCIPFHAKDRTKYNGDIEFIRFLLKKNININDLGTCKK